MQDLTGTWHCTDHGTYYITQRDNNIYINGINNSTNDYFTNVGFGVIDEDSNSAIVHWTNMPNSSNPYPHGIEYLDLSKKNKIIKVKGTSYGFGNFTR